MPECGGQDQRHRYGHPFRHQLVLPIPTPSSDEVLEWWGDDIRWSIDMFGPARCMFTSNFPVDRRSIGYTVLWNAFQKASGSYSGQEQASLFADTAARVYRIEAQRQ